MLRKGIILMKDDGQIPLLKALEDNQRLKATPFHMPGHKKGMAIHHKLACLVREDPFGLDLTEIPGLDDLHNPTGPIAQAQIRAARLFGADATFFLINGTTAGIHAAVLATCRHGGEILIPRDAHRSVIGACILAGVGVKYLPVTLDGSFHVPCPPTPEEIAVALKSNPGIKAVLYTYPTYYGLAGNLPKVASAVHKYNIPLIVDEAHGAHFRFGSSLPPSALESGADISIQSTHKTLGAFTQASMLHIKGNLIGSDEIARELRILQSTSPSYLLMASLDAAVGHLETSGKAMVENTLKLAGHIRAELNEVSGVRCLGQEEPDSGSAEFDPTKIYLAVSGLGLTGHQAANLLLREHQIQVELADRDNVLLMVSIGNTIEDGHRVISAVKSIAAKAPHSHKQKTLEYEIRFPIPKIRMTPREAWLAARKSVKLEEASGQVSAEIIAPYPPGIPILCPGEVITPEIILAIRQLKAENASFQGPADTALHNIGVVANLAR